MKAPIITVLCALCLFGCKQKDISGVIIEKHQTPYYTSFMYSGKSLLLIPHPATYKVTVANDTAQSTIAVNDNTYFSINVGDSAKVIEGKLIIIKP